jgi:hypothetical protein
MVRVLPERLVLRRVRSEDRRGSVVQRGRGSWRVSGRHVGGDVGIAEKLPMNQG